MAWRLRWVSVGLGLWVLLLPLAAWSLPDGVQPQDLHPIGPPLTALRGKLADLRWLVAWLTAPARLRPHPLMRRFRLTAPEVQAVSAYLFTGSVPGPGRVAWRGGDRAKGRDLFVSRGCRGCHAIAVGESSLSPRIPHLGGIGVKVRGDWLFEWLKSPRAYDPDTAMPNLGLADDEVRDLVAFLLSHREGADVVAAAAGVQRRAATVLARRTIRRFDCARCHRIRGFQTVSPTSGWAVQPRGCNNCHAAGGGSRASAWREGEETSAAATALRDGRRLVGYYNCRGCHRIEGTGGAIAQHLERKTFAPPNLDGEGARVQTSWLTEYLQHPTRTRLWLQMRMPDFGLTDAEAVALARYFATVAGVEPHDEPIEPAPVGLVERGRRRAAHFKCGQCHPGSLQSPLPDGVDLDDLSIDLDHAKTRLRPTWVREFLARPKAVVGMETRMPAVFYSSDGLPNVETPDADIAAIAAWLLQPAESPGTPAPTPVHDPEGSIDWTVQPY